MPESLRETFLLHAQLPVFRRKVEKAHLRIKEWLEVAHNPYVAFSGGKDSTCILALARSYQVDIPAIYFDAACAFPEVISLLAATPHCTKYPADEPFLETLKRYGLTGQQVEAETMRTTVYGPIRRLLADYHFDGVCYGLRAEESRGRAINAYVRGAVFQYKRDEVWACQPIWDWSYMEVWSYIVSRGLPYCGVYDRLWDAPREDQRISYWAGETKRRWGRYAWLKRNYPQLWNQLVAAVPEASAYV